MHTDFDWKFSAEAAKIRRSKRQSKKNFVVCYKMIFRATEENYDHDNHNGDSEFLDRVMLPYNEIEEILSGDNPCPIILGTDGHVVLAYDCYRDQSGEIYLLIYDPTQSGTNYKTVNLDGLFSSSNGVDFFLTLYYWNS